MNEVITYSCHGFNDDLPKGKASGTLTIYENSIACNIAGHSCSMPLAGLQIKMGGAGDRLVFLTHPSLPDWSFYTSDRNILNNVFLRRQQPLKQHLRKAQSLRLFNWVILTIAVLAMVALPLIFFANIDNMSRIIARQIPLAWEQQLGETAYEQFSASVQKMDKKIADSLLKPMTIHLE